MAVELASAYVSILPSGRNIARNLEKELKGPARQAGRTAGEALEEGLSDGAQKGAKSAGASIGSLLGGAAVLGGINKVRDAASDLQQAVGGTAAVFGEASGSVDAFATSAAEAVGLSERAAREATSQIGALFKGFGFSVDEAAAKAIDLTKVGADLAATFGGTTAEAVDALAAALRGETDPIERYGISLRAAAVGAEAVRLGLADSATQVDAHARAVATLEIITGQAGDALGQFAREADSAAGSAQIAGARAEDAAASLGDALLPISAKVTDALGTIAEGFASLPEPVQNATIAFAGIVAAVPFIERAKTAVGALRAATVGLSPLLGGLAIGAFAIGKNMSDQARNTQLAADATTAYTDAINDSLPPVDAFKTATATAFAGSRFGDDLEEAGADVSVFAEALRTQGDAIEDLHEAFVQPIQTADQLEERLRDLGITSEPFIDQLRIMFDTLGESGLRSFVSDLQIVGGAFEDATPPMQAFEGQFGGLADNFLRWRDSDPQEAGPIIEGLGAAAEGTASGLSRMNDALDENISNLRDVFGLASSASEAEIAFRDTLGQIADEAAAVADGTLTGQERIDSFATLLIDGRDNALDYAEALLQTGTSTDEVIRQTNGMIDELFGAADQAGLTRSEVELLRTQYGLLPEQVATTITSNVGTTLADAIALRDALAALGGAAVVDVNTTLRGPHAHTGPIGPGTWLVGEKGPELLHLDSGFARGFMQSTRDTAAVFAGAGGSVSIGPVIGHPDEWTLALLERAGAKSAAARDRDRAWSLS